MGVLSLGSNGFQYHTLWAGGPQAGARDPSSHRLPKRDGGGVRVLRIAARDLPGGNTGSA